MDVLLFKTFYFVVLVTFDVISICFRTATARGKAEQADVVAKQARSEAEIARRVARTFAPEFQIQSNLHNF